MATVIKPPTLIEIIESFRRNQHHHEDGDSFYSCPLHPEYSGNQNRMCDCSFDRDNAKVDEALRLAGELTARAEAAEAKLSISDVDMPGLYIANEDCLKFSDALGNVLRWVGKANKPPVTEIIKDLEVMFELDRQLAGVELATAEIAQAREAGFPNNQDTYTFRPERFVDRNELEKIRARYEESQDSMIVPLSERATVCPRCERGHFWKRGEGGYVCECGLVVEKQGALDPASSAILAAQAAKNHVLSASQKEE